jgi:hypothetical protein
MKVLAWNCRGLAHAPTIRALRALNKLHMAVIIFLSKTKIQPTKICLVLKKIGFSSCVQIPLVGLNEDLFIAWKNEVDLEPMKQDAHQITCLVYSDSPISLRCFLLCMLLISIFYSLLLGSIYLHWQLLSRFLAFTWEF